LSGLAYMNDENKYLLNFDCKPIEALDSIALKACQKFNYENKDNWFLSFRMGKIGCYSRLFGVRKHSLEMHSWEQPNNQITLEYHISSIFFHMDSAIECLTFMLNAFGFGIEPALFHDITNEKELRQIFPKNIIGPQDKNLVKGYDKYFPSLKLFMITNRDLINKISDHHDISKHTKSIFMGGRRDTKLIKQLGELSSIPIEELVLVAPFEEIIMESEPKEKHDHGQNESNKIDKLEEIVIAFCDFINGCSLKAEGDAKANIHLKDQ